jgi:pimeloyl-ACP methyl ester carboxylesterase
MRAFLRICVWSITFLLLTLCHVCGQDQIRINYGNNKATGNFKPINGIKLYYETYGEGKPLIFLHGNGGSIRSATAKIEFFKKHFKVIAIDSRGHGKSLDTLSHELTYTQMSEDIHALMDSLHIDSAYVSGQSDGGILGLLLAIHHPEKIAKLVTFGANIFPGKKAVFDEIDKMVRDTLRTTKDQNTIRMYKLLAYQPHISEKALQQIHCPVLLISGDRDAIRLEHTLKLFYNIPHSNLFVMPGATHFGSYQKPDLFNAAVLDFLQKPFSKQSTVDIMTGKK